MQYQDKLNRLVTVLKQSKFVTGAFVTNKNHQSTHYSDSERRGGPIITHSNEVAEEMV